MLWEKIELHNLKEAWSWEAHEASARITGTYLESKWSLEGAAFVFNYLHGALCHKVNSGWTGNEHVVYMIRQTLFSEPLIIHNAGEHVIYFTLTSFEEKK